MAVPSILIVDDEECIRDFLNLALCSHAEVTEAIDGMDALNKAQQNHFDLIISDIQMPHLNGLALYEKLQASDPNITGRFVFCTGCVDDDVYNFVSENELRLCRKPIELSALNTIIHEMLPTINSKTW